MISGSIGNSRAVQEFVLQRMRRFRRHHVDAELPKVKLSPAPAGDFFRHAREEEAMNSEISDSINSLNGPSTGMTGNAGAVHKVAQKAHEAVDKLEQTLGSSSERVMGWQQEYGEMAREQVRSNPLTVVAGAFAVGFLFAKLMR
jgi:ElaB/YqjD/DUF883 family membrane-anchored ribosome-binding protein